jgi:hypothetical protein
MVYLAIAYFVSINLLVKIDNNSQTRTGFAGTSSIQLNSSPRRIISADDSDNLLLERGFLAI